MSDYMAQAKHWLDDFPVDAGTLATAQVYATLAVAEAIVAASTGQSATEVSEPLTPERRVFMLPRVDELGRCGGCGDKPTRETGRCRCIVGVATRITLDAERARPVPPDGLQEALDSISHLTTDVPAAHGDPESYYRGQLHRAIGTAARALAASPAPLDVERLARAYRIVERTPVTFGSSEDNELEDAERMAQAIAREYEAQP